MSASATEQVLSALIESDSIDTIEKINMFRCANFSSYKAQTLLAQFIDRAHNLTEFETYEQLDRFRVRVAVRVDRTEKGGKPGLIRVIGHEQKDDEESYDDENAKSDEVRDEENAQSEKSKDEENAKSDEAKDEENA